MLGACLNAAIAHGYAARNPVRDLPNAERPRPGKKEAAYFEDEELTRLFAKLERTTNAATLTSRATSSSCSERGGASVDAPATMPLSSLEQQAATSHPQRSCTASPTQQ